MLLVSLVARTLGYGFDIDLMPLSDFVIERQQLFEFWFAFISSSSWINALSQPLNVARAVFRIDGP